MEKSLQEKSANMFELRKYIMSRINKVVDCKEAVFLSMEDREMMIKLGEFNLPSHVNFRLPQFDVQGGNDTNVKSSRIFELSKHNFDEFLTNQDTALVMFYDHGMLMKSKLDREAKMKFMKAAEATMRPEAAFATVDCTRNSHLCEMERVTSFPHLKLYSRGIGIGSIADTTLAKINSSAIQDYVEKAPVALIDYKS